MVRSVKKIKVMHILNTASFSGAENVVINIIDNDRDNVEGVYVSRDGSIREVLEQKKIPFYAVEKLRPRQIKKIIYATKPDIIHAHDFRAGIVAACSTSEIPIINHLHNNTPWLKSVNCKSILFKLFSAKYEKVLTVSDSVMKEFVFGHSLERKTKVVGNPIELRKVREKAKEYQLKCSYDIAFLGRLSEQKNPFFFLEIVNQLKKTIPNLKVAIIGDGELRKDVEKQIVRLKLKNTIDLYGFLSNPYPVLEASKVLCMPSKWEGFGLAAVEALTLGKPVFASPVGGLVNIVNSKCGELCTSFTEYTVAVEKILTNEQSYAEKSQCALERANELENMNEYMDMLRNLYIELIKNGETK